LNGIRKKKFNLILMELCVRIWYTFNVEKNQIFNNYEDYFNATSFK